MQCKASWHANTGSMRQAENGAKHVSIRTLPLSPSPPGIRLAYHAAFHSALRPCDRLVHSSGRVALPRSEHVCPACAGRLCSEPPRLVAARRPGIPGISRSLNPPSFFSRAWTDTPGRGSARERASSVSTCPRVRRSTGVFADRL